MSRFDDTFAAMMRDMASREGEELLREELIWRERVPASVDAAARLALAEGGAPPARGIPARPAVKTPLSPMKLAILTVAAATALGAGACAASPSLRTALRESLPFAASRESDARQPGGYTVPMPGPDFTLTEEAEGERMLYRWFTAGSREVLVQIALRLPQSDTETGPGEPQILSGGVLGSYYESGEGKTLILRDGEVLIRITVFRLSREELTEYAERIIAENGVG